MKRCINSAVLFSVVVFMGCLAGGSGQTEPSATPIESVLTDLGSTFCKEFVDDEDPNETTLLKCPGVAGYTLVVRHVGSGRQSIDVITPTNKEFPLEYHEIVSRHMLNIDNTAEWRVITKNGRTMPIALVIGVKAHENLDEPELVTHAYLALAKITSHEICVTDRILAGSLSHEEICKLADSSHERDCLKPLPNLAIN